MESFADFASQYYGYFIMVLSSLTSTLLKDVAKDSGKHFSSKKSFVDKNNRLYYIADGKKQKNKGKRDRLWEASVSVFMYLLLYCLLTQISVFVYACVKAVGSKDSIGYIFRNMAGYYFWSHVPSFIIVPVIVGIFKWLFSLGKSRRKIVIKGVAVICTSIMLFASPFFLDQTMKPNMPMESEILTELRTMDFPYENRVFNPTHLHSLISDGGYWTDDVQISLKPDMSQFDSNNEESLSKPTKSLDSMSFRELIYAVRYYDEQDDTDEVNRCLEYAYEVYQRLGAERINDWNAVGSMFFFLGRYNQAEYYNDGAKAFLNDYEYGNAFLCYKCLFDDDGSVENAQKLINTAILVIDNGDNSRNIIHDLENAYISMFDNGYNLLNGELEELCETGIGSPLLNILNISNHISEGRYDDDEIIQKYLNEEDYRNIWNCPKLMIIDCLYKLHNGQEYNVEALYKLYKYAPSYFEYEDRINLVWLLYKNGEYIKTYEISRVITGEDKEDETEAVVKNGPDEQADEVKANDSVKYSMLVLRAKSYLQDKEALPNIDEIAFIRI